MSRATNNKLIDWRTASLTATNGERIQIRIAEVPSAERYTQEQLAAAFARVEHPENWKYPIDALIPASDRDLTAAAIAHFTASEANFSDAGCGLLRVTAVGYYSAVGA